MEIVRIERPDVSDYQDAFQVTENIWPYLAALNTTARFSTFPSLGVELLVARRSGQTVGACFVLPERYSASSGTCDFVWLFDFAVSPEGRGAGAAMIGKAMRWYPNLIAVGVTKHAAALYEGLKWKRFGGLWRCVHPLDVRGFLEAYSPKRPSAVWKAISVAAPLYKMLSSMVERAARRLGPRACVLTGAEVKAPPDNVRFRAAVQYLPSVSVRSGAGEIIAIQRARTGRILADGTRGLSRIRAHLLVWAYLRAQGACLCEYVANSPPAAFLAPLLGYVPVRMPLYYRDVGGALEPYITSLRTQPFGFGNCEKIL